ncbi:unnamed protein product [Malus baccata var. baccata]
MYVLNNEELKKEILDEAHCSAYAMHPGGTKMYHTIRPFYYWPGMKREIAEYVSSKSKQKERSLLDGCNPQWKWENITMDFVYKLPHTQNGFDGIWKALGTKLLYSTAYHPQIDGQSERTIQTLEDMLRSSVLQFEVGERVLEGPEIVDETTQNVQVIKSNLKAAQDRQKSLAYRHATDRVYDVGNLVFLKLSPWRGVVRFGKKGKLSPRYIGPYEITERIGEVAYRLELLPELSKVHNVFHVSMLRHYVSDPSYVIPPQPLEINPDLTYDEEPVAILDWKDKVLRNKTVSLVKVLWRNHSVEEAT